MTTSPKNKIHFDTEIVMTHPEQNVFDFQHSLFRLIIPYPLLKFNPFCLPVRKKPLP